MRSKSDTVTGWIRGKKGESKQKPKMSPLVPGKPRLGNTDHPQLNRLTSQPQAVGALVGGGGVYLSTCSQGAPSHQKLTSRAGASASAPKQDGKVPGHPHPQKSSGAGSSISPTRQQGNNQHLLCSILLCNMKNVFKCT